MLAQEVIRSCSNARVAQAALVSIGGDFTPRFAAEAARRGLSGGGFAARLVRAFARRAAADDLEGFERATRGADLPVLVGLKFILERGLSDAAPEERGLAGRLPVGA